MHNTSTETHVANFDNPLFSAIYWAVDATICRFGSSPFLTYHDIHELAKIAFAEADPGMGTDEEHLKAFFANLATRMLLEYKEEEDDAHRTKMTYIIVLRDAAGWGHLDLELAAEDLKAEISANTTAHRQ